MLGASHVRLLRHQFWFSILGTCVANTQSFTHTSTHILEQWWKKKMLEYDFWAPNDYRFCLIYVMTTNGHNPHCSIRHLHSSDSECKYPCTLCFRIVFHEYEQPLSRVPYHRFEQFQCSRRLTFSHPSTKAHIHILAHLMQIRRDVCIICSRK